MCWLWNNIEKFGVIATIAVFVVLFFQLSAIRNEQTLTLRPYVSVQQVFIFDQDTKATTEEIWGLSYIVGNSGQYPAKNVFLYIAQTESQTPPAPTVPINTKPFYIVPGSSIQTNQPYLRAEAIRITKAKGTVYRHIHVKYQDAKGNEYFSSASWKLQDYEVGQPIIWDLINAHGN